MPRSFPDMASLRRAAESWGFRQQEAAETDYDYRMALADHVQPKDIVESCEIRTGNGWNAFDHSEQLDLVRRQRLAVLAKGLGDVS